ncbi:MAG TPA: NADH-quinone oxidoreductase subunit I [bacterium]|nr:NADH-quinone oxidoreductase subunit I [bacterium]HQG45419.1 NADH-quinone oxidoreductase subunit I [bacterium]HQI49924.1 NADH-quinone oxidoreductase subunit I [bacterium]HQJ63941.1 NADH-quinone oxidoreductase subunit I [bacterium]
MGVKNVGYRPERWDQAYLPGIFKGMWITIKHFFGKKYTISYPEEKWPVPPGHRGAIRLNKDDEGRIKCVACEMCSTACPAQCITMKAGVAPWPDREKYPVEFTIDMLRCILCGMCQEACPEDAIELTEIYDFSAYSREDLIWDEERLLRNYDITADGKYFERSKAETGM